MSFFHGFADEMIKQAIEDPYEYSTKGGAVGLSLGAILGAIVGASIKGSRIKGSLTGTGLGALFGLGAGKTVGAIGDIARIPGAVIDRWKEL